MIRIKDGRGRDVTPPAARFVEVCSADGKLARVLFADAAGVVKILAPADKEFKDYCRVMNVAPAEIIKIEEQRK